MGKRKQRHLSKDELCQCMMNRQKYKNMAIKAPYMGINTIAMWVLWQKKGFTQERIVKYDQDYKAYRDDFNLDVDALNQRYFEFTNGEYIDFDWLDSKDISNTGCKFLDTAESKKADAEIQNIMNRNFAEYLIIMVNVMIDYGYTPDEVVEVEHLIAEEIDKMDMHSSQESKSGLWWYWNDLRDNLGIEVEKVKW